MCFFSPQSFYVATSCQLRRLEAVSRSPIYSHLGESVQGAGVVRAFGEQQRFILQADQLIERNQEAYFPRFVATRFPLKTHRIALQLQTLRIVAANVQQTLVIAYQ